MRNEIVKKMFRVVCYIRIDLEDVQDPLTQQEALLEKEHLDLLHPDAGGPRSPHKTKGNTYPHAEPPEVWVIPVVIWISRELMMIAPRAAAHHTIRSGCAVWSFPHMVPSPGENRGSCRGGRARWRSDPPTGSTWRG